jgi:hypothetical protein
MLPNKLMTHRHPYISHCINLAAAYPTEAHVLPVDNVLLKEWMDARDRLKNCQEVIANLQGWAP